jgi:hypothetical protein
MIKTLAAALALSLALPALAEEPSGKLSKEPDLTKKPASKKPPPPKDTPAQAQYKAIRTAKAGFMAAVAACTRPETCDPKSPARDPEAVASVKKMERNFVDVCEACASVEVCEEERQKILAGTASFNKNPCFKPTADAKGEGSKKDGAKGDGAKKEGAKSDAPKKDAAKADAPKKEAPKGDAAKPEAK